MFRKITWRKLLESFPAGLVALLLLITLAFAAAPYAAQIRFRIDPALAPRDTLIYKEDVNRIAGAGFLTAAIGRDDMYSFQTASTIGGVIFQGLANPGRGFSGKEIDLRYNPNLADGERLEITIDGEKFKHEALHDWALIPISHYANSPYTAVVSLLGKPQRGEQEFALSFLLLGQRPYWVQIHPDLKDTLVGFNALLADAMFLGGDPTATRAFTESLMPLVSGWNKYTFEEGKSADAGRVLRRS
jgi:hypothetical protein